MAATNYAVVQDVPASWETYRQAVATLGATLPAGLIVHVAGPTDEGFRVIDVWESRLAWETFRDERLPSLLRTIRTTTRDLDVRHLYLAEERGYGGSQATEISVSNQVEREMNLPSGATGGNQRL